MDDPVNPYRPPDAPLREPPDPRHRARWGPALAYATLSAASVLAMILGGLAKTDPDGGITFYGGPSVRFGDFATLGSLPGALALIAVCTVSLGAAAFSVRYNGWVATVWALVALPIGLVLGYLLQRL